MASKTKKEHRKRVKKFQERMTHKIKEINKQIMNLPEIREVPVWAKDAEITITGAELEMFYNYISSVNGAFSAAQSVLQRNILNGKIKVEFDKLVTDSKGNFGYVRMSEDESKDHREQFYQLVNQLEQMRNASNEVQVEPQADIPVTQPPTEEPSADAEQSKVVVMTP